METHKRSIVKSLTFRILATIITLVIVWIFTRDIVISSSVTIAENLLKMLIYYLHERAWAGIAWGTK